MQVVLNNQHDKKITTASYLSINCFVSCQISLFFFYFLGQHKTLFFVIFYPSPEVVKLSLSQKLGEFVHVVLVLLYLSLSLLLFQGSIGLNVIKHHHHQDKIVSLAYQNVHICKLK